MFFPNVPPQKLLRPRNLTTEDGARITIRDGCIRGSMQLNSFKGVSPILSFISLNVFPDGVTPVSLRKLFFLISLCVSFCSPLHAFDLQLR